MASCTSVLLVYSRCSTIGKNYCPVFNFRTTFSLLSSAAASSSSSHYCSSFSSSSSSNTYTKTFSGNDGAGRRLACVIEVVQRAESLKKISLLAHSLGGLFARHAIAILYSPNNLGNREPDNSSKVSSIRKHDLIAGLVPVNFVNLATPHHGVRERKQPPLVVEIPVFEKLASPIAKAKEVAQTQLNISRLWKEMIRGLQRLGWKKVDVSFHSAVWPFFVHNNIHVKNKWLHNTGAGIVAHVADSLMQQESSPFLAVSF